MTSQIIFQLKNLDTLNASNSQDLQTKLKQSYLNDLIERFKNYINSLEYINKNKNLVFFREYLQEIETDIINLHKEFKSQNLREIYKKLEKENLYIYESIYMYEDYFLAMLIATVLLAMSPLIRIASGEIRAFLFDFGQKDEDYEKESYFEKLFNFILDL